MDGGLGLERESYTRVRLHLFLLRRLLSLGLCVWSMDGGDGEEAGWILKSPNRSFRLVDAMFGSALSIACFDRVRAWTLSSPTLSALRVALCRDRWRTIRVCRAQSTRNALEYGSSGQYTTLDLLRSMLMSRFPVVVLEHDIP